MISSDDRGANTIDVLRFFAAFTVVWFHSNYSVQNAALLSLQTFLNESLLTWALIFFYSISAFFAIKTGFSKPVKTILGRLKKIFILIVIIGLMYELFRFVGSQIYGNNYQFALTANGLYGVWDWMVSANSSAGYFLWFVFLYTLLAIPFGKIKNPATFLILLTCLAIIFYLPQTNGYAWLLGLRQPLGEIGLVVGFGFGLLVCIRNPLQKTLTWTSILVLVMAFIGFFLANTVLPKSYLLINSSIFGLFILWFSYTNYSINGKNMSRLSDWGKRYSLGIFLFHPFVMAPLDKFVPQLLNSPHLSYFVINTLGFFLTFALVVLITKRFSLKFL